MMKNLLHDPLDEHGSGLPDFLVLLRRRRVWIVTVFLATVLTTYVGLQLLTEQYETRASVLVKLGRENAEVPATVEKGGVFTTGVRKEEINSEIQMLSSPSLAAAAVDAIGPDAFVRPAPRPEGFFSALRYYVKQTARWVKDQGRSALIVLNLKKRLNDREKAIAAIQDALEVEREKDSDVINVHMRSPDPTLARRVLEKLLHLYRDEHIRVRREVQVREVFDAQVSQRKLRLREIEAAREQVRAKYNLSSAPEQRQLLLHHLQELRNSATAMETEKVTLRAQQALMRNRLAAMSDNLPTAEVVTPNPSLQTIKERITTLQGRKAELSTRYAPESQVIKNLDEEIAALQKILSSEERTLVASVTSEANPLKRNFLQSIEQFEVRIIGLDASLEDSRAKVRQVEDQLRQLGAGEYQLEVIERERKIAEENYLAYTKRGEEAYIDEELNRSLVANVAILNPPASSVEPVYPPKLLVMGLSLPLGLTMGIGLVLFLEYAADRVSNARDVETVDGVSCLGTFHIPLGEEATTDGDGLKTFLHSQLGRFR